MRTWEGWEYLRRGPQIAWDAMIRCEYRFDYDLMPIVVRAMGVDSRFPPIEELRAGAAMHFHDLAGQL